MWEGRREAQTKTPQLPFLLSEVALNKSGLGPLCLSSAESLSKVLRQAHKFLKRQDFRGWVSKTLLMGCFLWISV